MVRHENWGRVTKERENKKAIDAKPEISKLYAPPRDKKMSLRQFEPH